MWMANGRNLAPQQFGRSQDGSNRKVLNGVSNAVLGEILGKVLSKVLGKVLEQ